MRSSSISIGGGGGGRLTQHNSRSAYSAASHYDGGRDPSGMLAVSEEGFHSDCDSEGNDPPTFGEFINPLTVDETAPPPKAAAQDSKLPLSVPAEQRRVREAYEPPINYEDWVEGEDATAAMSGVSGGKLRTSGSSRGELKIKRTEEDSDFPLGRPYAYHAFCPTCTRQYYPVVPSAWKCLRCAGPVWQQPTDRDSKRCAVCERHVAKNRKIFHVKIQNPLTLNPHVCKRCGRIVCDQCYSPVPVDVSEYGYKTPQKVCTMCVRDMELLPVPPQAEDLGSLYDENALLEMDDEVNLLPYWPPKCIPCSISMTKPPPRWECEMCRGHMWQPMSAPDSETCWICNAPHPQSRCHRCGQLSCKPCGAYAQPLPELGFTEGVAMSVCKVCYTGLATCVVPTKYERLVKEEVAPRTFEPQCAQCRAPQSSPPPRQWVSNCHKNAKCWETGTRECSLCTTPISESTAQNCRGCGHAVCLPCSQYRCPLPQRGYPPDEGQIVCRACFHPQEIFMPDHCDERQWRPYCPTCHTVFDRPPPRWRCVNECGNVWQPTAHIASVTCHCCGTKVSQPVNCRRCGRIVCAPCGRNRTELVELGFTRGQVFPTCTKCVEWAEYQRDAVETARREQSIAEAERQRRMASARAVSTSSPPPSALGASPSSSRPQVTAAAKGPPPGWKGPPPGFKGPPPGWKGPPPGFKGPPLVALGQQPPAPAQL